MRTLKLPTCEDEYDAMLSNRSTVIDIPATALWTRRLGGPQDTLPTEVTYCRGLFGSHGPRRNITVAVEEIVFDPKGSPNGGPFGVFHIRHAAPDAANEKTEETP